MKVETTDKSIGTILKHDKKITTYKMALVRAINDVVLSFPDVAHKEHAVAVPLRMLAEFWLAYYWPFANANTPIIQGQTPLRDGVTRNDMSFRPVLEQLREQWEAVIKTGAVASDGFFLLSEFRTPRRRAAYSPELQNAHKQAIAALITAIHQPIRYAGAGEYTVFEKPRRLFEMGAGVIALPGTLPNDVCVLISSGLWESFRSLSLWIEALSIHEWCLFSERVAEERGDKINRGDVYFLLTSRPDNRRPLTWERNRVEVLMMEGTKFVCPWTKKVLAVAGDFDIDHLLPLAIYPVNELWNLLPADKEFNQHIKRDRIPSAARLAIAEPLIAAAYANYEKSPDLKQAVREDAGVRFSALPTDAGFSLELAKHTVRFIEQVAGARSVTRF
ncbi:HNH endonuclease [Abditibacterium utsteinense]|uniref:HNH endonuclease n=1 Tax=Abditibacterium utsteinense TaxID=1960156 RepID=A0A2S8SWU1_9BACT|nr:HNH endonuclease domain-containing protein [Abditibacterium utsteinense]PQV65268.1 HNH endonuclease [Abditibacterium utsteinense]